MKTCRRGQELPPGIDPPLPMSVTQRRCPTIRRCCGSTRNTSPGCCHCRPSSASGCSAAIGRFGPPPGCISNASGVALLTRFRRISTLFAIGIFAATEKTEFNDPDWTVGFKLGRDRPVIPGLPKLPSRAALRFDDQQISRLAMFRSCPSSLVLSSPAPCLTLPTRVIGCLSLTSRDTMAEWRHPLSLR